MSLSALCSFALFGASVLAQQYAGDYVPGSLPQRSGSELTYFKIRDPSGGNDHTTLINYYSLGSDGQRIKPSNVQRAVIMMSGQRRDAYQYIGYAMDALATANPAYGPTKDNVAIIAPFFANNLDKNVAYPFDDNSGSSSTNALVWDNYDWAYGRNNIYPASSTNVSSFHVLDEIVAYFSDSNTFPHMHEIVVAAHSMGAQLVQRYAAVTPVGSTDRIKVTFWPSDPNSYGWLSDARPPGPYVDCNTWDNYPEGFSNYESDKQHYGAALVARGHDAVRANYESKQISYLRSTQDTGDYNTNGCGAYSQGPNRDVRFLNFMNMFPPKCDNGPASGNCDTVDYVDESHDAAAACKSNPGMSRLFYDNFDGNGGRAFDFGPRRTAGDSPFPGQ